MTDKIKATVSELKAIFTRKLSADERYYEGIKEVSDGYYEDANGDRVTFDKFSKLTANIRKLKKTIQSIDDMVELI